MNEKIPKMLNQDVSVPKFWLESLIEYSEKVRGQIEKLPTAEYHTIFKTDISALIGYASSAKTILKYNK